MYCGSVSLFSEFWDCLVSIIGFIHCFLSFQTLVQQCDTRLSFLTHNRTRHVFISPSDLVEKSFSLKTLVERRSQV